MICVSRALPPPELELDMTPGSHRLTDLRKAVKGRSPRGTIHGGVRWNTLRLATLAAISGTNWMALPSVPITATRLPRKSKA